MVYRAGGSALDDERPSPSATTVFSLAAVVLVYSLWLVTSAVLGCGRPKRGISPSLLSHDAG